MARLTVLLAIAYALLVPSVAAFQGNIFEQFFQGQQHAQGPPENAPSNSDHYQREFDHVHCDKYLCPGTLACVHFPHHCPCAFPEVEAKVELGDGIAVCASEGGYKSGETERKIELARKGLL